MLSSSEIRLLEERWKKYNRRRYIKFSLIIFLSLICLSLIIYSVTIEHEKNDNKGIEYINIANKKIKKVTKNVEKNISQKNYYEKNVTIKRREDTNAKKMEQKIKAISIDAMEKSIVKEVKSRDIVSLNKDFLKNIYKNIEQNNQAVNGSINKTVNNTESIKNSSKNFLKDKKIVISSKKINRIKYLKKRFSESSKAEYATLISKEFYSRGEYKKALKWAIISNNIDSNSKESWILFAKSKVKLGKRSDAIRALEEFLKANHSNEVVNLLHNIKSGIFK